MFCERCGEAISGETNFCNRCGTRINKAEAAEVTANTNRLSLFIVVATTVLGVAGFAFMAGIIALLLGKGAESKAIIFIAFAFASAIFGICYALIQQLSKAIDRTTTAKLYSMREDTTSHNLASPVTSQLPPQRETPASVTERTTRTLEEAVVKR